LLTHKNLYTGKEYRDEPSLAFIEIVNENSLVEASFGKRLTGTQTTTQTTTWSDKKLKELQQITLNKSSILFETGNPGTVWYLISE